ncbi:pyruvate carboxylase [compost metagenome]
MAKLIVTGATREEVLRRARRALKEFRIEGIATVLPFHRAAIETEEFVGESGFKVHTRWIETDFAARLSAAARPEPVADAHLIRTHVEIDGKRHALGIPATLLAGVGGLAGASASLAAAKAEDAASITAPISGTLQAFKVEDGADVAAGDLIAVMEAMKMETQVTASRAGKIRIRTEAGAYLQAGAEIARFED